MLCYHIHSYYQITNYNHLYKLKASFKNNVISNYSTITLINLNWFIFTSFNSQLFSKSFRRKRHYASQNIEDILLRQYGIEPIQLMPQSCLNGKTPDGSWASFLSLETFDNTEYDCRNWEEWLLMGEEDRIRKPVPGRALLPDKDNQHKRKF